LDTQLLKLYSSSEDALNVANATEEQLRNEWSIRQLDECKYLGISTEELRRSTAEMLAAEDHWRFLRRNRSEAMYTDNTSVVMDILHCFMRISEKLLHQFISDLVISNCQLITKTAKAKTFDVIERTINNNILKTGIGSSSNIKLKIVSGSVQVSDMGYYKLRAILVLLPKEDFAFPVGSLSHDKWLQ